MENNNISPSAPDPVANEPGSQPIQTPSKKKYVAALVIAAIIILGGAAFFFFKPDTDKKADTSSNSQQTSQPGPNDFAEQYLRDCKQDRTVSFTSSPVPTDQLGYIEPMGKVADGHVTPTDHVYLSPVNTRAADNTYDVVMPADGTVTAVSAMPAQYIGDRNQQTAPEDHRLIITHNCQYVSIFIHVHQLSDALQTAIGGKMQPNTNKQVSIELKAGDKLGKIGGNPVDWSLMDATKTLAGFITPDLYKGESWKIHVIDPLSVYTGSLKDQLVAKSLRSTAPYGGKIDYDKKGALVGNWFREGTNGYAGADQSRYWDGHLSIVPNYIDPASTTVSIGNWQGKAAQFTAMTGPAPATVTAASGPVKYELIDMGFTAPSGQHWSGNTLVKGLKATMTGTVKGTLLVEVQSEEKLKVERFPDKMASQVSGFTAAAQIFTR